MSAPKHGISRFVSWYFRGGSDMIITKGGFDVNQQKIGEFLKHLRKEQGLTQEQLAEAFYVSSRTVSRWETGSNMPDLEILIASGSSVRDLNAFSNCRNLVFLELANCMELRDISALTGCTSLRFLNLSYAKIEDLSALDELPLTHLCLNNNNVTEEERLRFAELKPDCWIIHGTGQDYGTGWRYDENGDKLEWYAKLADAFRYPDPYNKTGWYLQ